MVNSYISSNWIGVLKSKIENFMKTGVIMQWGNIHKSILVLALGGLDFIIWLIWLSYSYHSASLNHWINADHYNFYFNFYLLGSISFFFLIWVCYRFQKHLYFQKIMPILAIAFFGIMMLFAGFSIGISSPATIAGYISVVSVGLVLYDRKIIYLTLVPATVALLTLITLCAKGLLDYAPIFSDKLESGGLFQNAYWVYSQLFLYIPLFLVSMSLFELLLIQWRNREKWIKDMSRKDPLTRILNRRSIGEFLTELENTHTPYAVILLDLDHFKKINDHYGHEAGDLVLVTVSKILAEHNLEHECLGRYGGEEFIMIIPQISKENAYQIAEKCRKHIAETFIQSSDGREFSISASFGVAISSKYSKKEDVIRMADQALYTSKSNGRNQVYIGQ